MPSDSVLAPSDRSAPSVKKRSPQPKDSYAEIREAVERGSVKIVDSKQNGSKESRGGFGDTASRKCKLFQ